MEKVNFPDNVYVKQTLTVEKGENIIYADYLLQGKITCCVFRFLLIILITSLDQTKFVCLIVVPFYDAQASGFKGLKETVGFISLGGDVD